MKKNKIETKEVISLINKTFENNDKFNRSIICERFKDAMILEICNDIEKNIKGDKK